MGHYADAVSQILLEQGRQQAQAQLQSGQAWGQAAQQLGQIPGQVIAQQSQLLDQRQHRQLVDQQIRSGQAAEEDRRLQIAAAQRVTVQDAALKALYADPTAPPTVTDVIRVVGPERGTKIFEGQAAIGKLQRDEYTTGETEVHKVMLGLSALPESERAPAWAGTRATLIAKGFLKPEDAPDGYDASWIARQVAYGVEQTKPGTKEIKTRNADGSETIRLVKDEPTATPFESAAPVPVPKGLQSESFLLDGKPVKGTFNPTDGTYQHQGVDVTARVKPIPPGSTNVNVGGLNGMYNQTDPKAIAAGIRRGEFPPDISQYGRPVQGAIASELAKPGPNQEAPFNLANAQRIWASQKRLNSTMNGGQQVRLDESIKSGLAMYDKVDEIADEWKGMGLGVLSRANLKAAMEGAQGPKAAEVANRLTGQIGQLTSDVATIEQGGLTPTNEARAVAEKSMQAWWGTGTIKAMTAQGRANMKIRETARADQTPFVGGNTGSQGQPVPAVAAPTPAAPTPTIRARDPQGHLHEAAAGTALPPGWTVVP